MTKLVVALSAVALALLLSGCSEEEHRDIGSNQARVALEKARHERFIAQVNADLQAETERRKDILEATTQRAWDQRIGDLGKAIVLISAICGVIAFTIYSVRRLGERAASERTRRHADALRAVMCDPHLSPKERRAIYGAAIEAAARRSTPRLGNSTEAAL